MKSYRQQASSLTSSIILLVIISQVNHGSIGSFPSSLLVSSLNIFGIRQAALFLPSYYKSSRVAPSGTIMDNREICTYCCYHRSSVNKSQLHLKAEDKDIEKAPSTAISDLDARVLQSILDEKKVDIVTEESMKNLLDSKRNQDERKEKNQSTYTSSIFQKFEEQLQDPFWVSIRTKASESFESAKIFLSNRIERDAKLLASVGLFTLIRVFDDTNRVMQLTSNSSFAIFKNRSEIFFLPSSDQINTVNNSFSYQDLYNELNTPLDEIKIVSESIRDIFKSSTTTLSLKNPRSRFTNSVNLFDQKPRLGLKSIAKAGNNNLRQQRAFERAQQTVINREKEPVNEKLSRVVSSMTSAAWEIQSEMGVEVNKPGYRSEKVRKQISSATNAMLKAGQVLSLDSISSATNRKLPSIDNDWEFSDGNSKKNTPPDATKYMRDSLDGINEEDMDIGDFVIPESTTLSNQDVINEIARMSACLRECIERPEQTWLPLRILIDLNNNEESDHKLEKIISAMESARDSLETIANSDWKQKSENQFKAQGEVMTDDDLHLLFVMNEDINHIVQLVREYRGEENADNLENKLRSGQAEIISTILNISKQSTPIPVERYLNNDTDNTVKNNNLWFAEVISNEVVSSFAFTPDTAETIASATDRIDFKNDKDSKGFKESYNSFQTVIVSDVIGVEAAVNSVESDEEMFDAVDTCESRADYPSTVSSDVDFEFVSNANAMMEKSIPLMEYDEKERNTSPTYAAEVVVGDDVDDSILDDANLRGKEETKQNIALNITLRFLDVLFFVVEKGLTVGIPSLYKSWYIMIYRADNVNRKGLGREGWERLENLDFTIKRY